MKIETIYKVSTILGMLVVIAASYISWSYLKKLEPYAHSIFKERILAELDLSSLNQQLLSMQQAITASRNPNNNPGAVSYSEDQLQRLVDDSTNIKQQVESQIQALYDLDKQHNSLLYNIKLTIVITIIVLILSTVFAVFGGLGWYFNIKIFEDRRSTPRD